MIGGPSTGGPKDPPRDIGMKDMGGLNQSTKNGRRGDLRGKKAREIRRTEEDLPGIKIREISEMEGEGRFRWIREEGRAVNLRRYNGK